MILAERSILFSKEQKRVQSDKKTAIIRHSHRIFPVFPVMKRAVRETNAAGAMAANSYRQSCACLFLGEILSNIPCSSS